jgi:hypothetical protein
MLSVIVCSISQELLLQVSENISNTVGVEYEIISINNEEKKWPIAKAYNEGASKAHFPFLLFVHEDVRFLSKEWGSVIEEKLKEPDCGVIGFAGSKVKLRCYSGWFQNRKWISALYYQHTKTGVKFEVANALLEHPFEEVVVLDGFGMFVRKEIWSEFPFDEKLLTGFHCYDLDFSLQIASSRRYKNYVCTSPKVLAEHISRGVYSQNWYEETIRMHKEKWNAILPLKVEHIEFGKKEERLYEERCFNCFVRKLLKTESPKKKEVLWSFLFYPQLSWKHFGHCIANIFTYLKRF